MIATHSGVYSARPRLVSEIVVRGWTLLVAESVVVFCSPNQAISLCCCADGERIRFREGYALDLVDVAAV